MQLAKDFEHTIEIERSRFLCYLKKCASEQEARDHIAVVRKLHPDASHHCTAFVIGEHDEIQRSSDDGEPSGTAGVPMLRALKSCGMQNTCAVVVRYFGGIKLGAGGLIRAYSRSVSEAVHLAPKVTLEAADVYSLSFSYDLIGKLDYLLAQKCVILEKRYEEQVTYLFYTEDSALPEAIREATNGRYLAQWLETRTVEKPVL